jgi:hypothetical protein
MSQHILFDTAVSKSLQPCAWCLGCNIDLCCVYLKTSKKQDQLDFDACGCELKVDFKLGNARKPTKANPCTKYPVRCPLCPKTSTAAVWRYNLKYHIQKSHPKEDPNDFIDDWLINKSEEHNMRSLWDNRMKKKGKRKSKKAATPVTALKVSDGHVAHLAVR